MNEEKAKDTFIDNTIMNIIMMVYRGYSKEQIYTLFREAGKKSDIEDIINTILALPEISKLIDSAISIAASQKSELHELIEKIIQQFNSTRLYKSKSGKEYSSFGNVLSSDSTYMDYMNPRENSKSR